MNKTKNDQPGFFFNIRVYGLITNTQGEILLSDEFQLGTRMTKFPGGGLKYGEGTLECLQREAREELGQELEQIKHFYTTDFFQKALYFENHQLISIYYTARLAGKQAFRSSRQAHDYPREENGSQSFRWLNLRNLQEEEMSLPVDKAVVTLLKRKIRQGS